MSDFNTAVTKQLAAKERKKKRLVKRRKLLPKSLWLTPGQLKKKLWSKKSLRIRLEGKRDHGMCKVCLHEFQKGERLISQINPIQDACHIVRKTRGLSIYFDDYNLFAGCKPHNYGEFRNPGLYDQKYREIFGDERVDECIRRSNLECKYSRADYMFLIEQEDLAIKNILAEKAGYKP